MPDRDDARREHGFHALTVRQVIDETADARSFVLDVPEDLADLFDYRSGQFCTFRARFGDEELLRSYSMSSAPETDDFLTVTVKRVPGGRVSNWFNDHVAVGDVLEVSKPAGVFCVRDGEQPIVAFAAGSGVTPVISIAKSALATTPRPVRMLYANRDRDSVIFDDALERLGTRHEGRLEVRRHHDDAAGFLDAAAIAAFVGDERGADFYLCGPAPFMDLVEATLLGLGVDPEQILLERFVDAAELSPVGSAGAAPPTAPTAAAVDEVTVILKGKRHALTHQPGDTLLETARRGGLPAPYSCEAGNCATCMAMLHEGTVRMRTNNALTPEEVAEGWVLTCQSVPTSPTIVVEYEPM